MRLGRSCATMLALGLAVAGCGMNGKERIDHVTHPVLYFEIAVTDMDRAIKFYEQLFDVILTRQEVDGYDMALFPFREGAPGATGALAMGDAYRPSKDGAIIYFHVPDIRMTVAKAEAMGRPVLYPVKDIGAAGLVAEIEDSEGNRLALSQLPKERK
jgi:predicted enzyme related to lactoylglutathione lyase